MDGRASSVRRRRVQLLACALAFAVLAAAAQSGTAASVIPWLDQHPLKASAHPPLAPPCPASALRAQLALQGATGSLVGGVTLRNVGAKACSLLGWPTVSFTGKAAKLTKWRVKDVPAQTAPLDVLTDPPGSLRALQPGKSVGVTLWWSNWCGPASRPASGPGPPPQALELTLASRTTIRIPVGQAPRCDQPQYPSTLSVGPYQPTLRHLPESSHLPLRVAILGGEPVLVKPHLRAFRAHRGERFQYVVAVTNTSGTAFRFAKTSCPTYIEQIVPSAGQAYVLNCRPVASIAPHAHVLFAMEYVVPTNIHLGYSSLTWELAPKTFNAPFAPAGLWISR
jgi:hypothetical protein